ncbi:MAG: type II secretion system protein GspM [Gemmatimonadaceae bacterium]
MKWSTMKPRERRTIIVGTALLLVGLVPIYVVRPYRAALSDARDQLAAEGHTLARERAAVATARENPGLQHVADSAMRATRPRLFEGRDDVMASAELASYLGEVALSTRVWLQDAGTRPASPSANGVRTLYVEIRAESDLAGVLKFIQALEHGDKLIRIDRLDISRSPRSDEKDVETLSVAATIAGFAVNDGPPSSPAAPGAAASGTARGVSGGEVR